jgi:hypothetical protein
MRPPCVSPGPGLAWFHGPDAHEITILSLYGCMLRNISSLGRGGSQSVPPVELPECPVQEWRALEDWTQSTAQSTTQSMAYTLTYPTTRCSCLLSAGIQLLPWSQQVAEEALL